MFNNQANPPASPAILSQDPPKLADQQSLEEIAAQMKAVNTTPAEPNLDEQTTPPILTSADEIPSSGINVPPIDTPESEKDAIDQLDDLKSLPVTQDNSSLGQKIAQALADNEVIGEHQIEEVVSVLTPELLDTLTGLTPSLTIPISVTNTDGTNLTLSVPAKSVFDFLSGHSDLVKAI